ncbi:MAG: bifunctional diaminohydroxyphosphoribosylaminopyrimidine deaminase/5-amino-6-(5-phosphoribosylamino)uracil reductase RibD [Cyclobacteriaceae bacterium]
MTPDQLFMQRAIELAQLGAGQVSPNPLVGCVVVHEGEIIGEGWHQKVGEVHAEVNAINAVKNKSILSQSTLYVNLEPCSHFGRTPPCADLLIEHKIEKVIIANRDPNPTVNGKGIEKLKAAGIEVIQGVLEKEGLELNKRFFTSINMQRPYVILKWAQTTDGFIAREDFDSRWISNEYSRSYVHKWRSEEDGILVGFNTAAHDNPQLTTRDWLGKNPVRIVIDKNLELDPTLHLFDGSTPTICYNFKKQEELGNLFFVKLVNEDIETQILANLFAKGLRSIIVEGGTKTINSFLSRGLWDEARVFISNKEFGVGIKAPVAIGVQKRRDDILGDKLIVFENVGP